MLAAFELPHGPAYALQDVQRLEARDDDGYPVARGQLGVLAHAHHAAHVPGGQEALDAAARRLHDRLDRRGHPDVGDQQAEVVDAEPLRLVDRHGVGRGGGLEADAEEHHLALRVLLRDAQGVQRGVDDAYVAALAAHLEQVTAGAGHPEHVPEGAEDHVGSGGDLQRLVDDLERGDAHGAARPVDQFDLLG